MRGNAAAAADAMRCAACERRAATRRARGSRGAAMDASTAVAAALDVDDDEPVRDLRPRPMRE